MTAFARAPSQRDFDLSVLQAVKDLKDALIARSGAKRALSFPGVSLLSPVQQKNARNVYAKASKRLAVAREALELVLLEDG